MMHLFGIQALLSLFITLVVLLKVSTVILFHSVSFSVFIFSVNIVDLSFPAIS